MHVPPWSVQPWLVVCSRSCLRKSFSYQMWQRCWYLFGFCGVPTPTTATLLTTTCMRCESRFWHQHNIIIIVSPYSPLIMVYRVLKDIHHFFSNLSTEGFSTWQPTNRHRVLLTTWVPWKRLFHWNGDRQSKGHLVPWKMCWPKW